MNIKEKDKKGLSLLLLVITIIVMIVLAGAIILALSRSSILLKSEDAVILSNMKTIQEYLEMKKLNGEDISKYRKVSQLGIEVPKSYDDWLCIRNGELYVNPDVSEKYQKIIKKCDIKQMDKHIGHDVIVLTGTKENTSVIDGKIYGATNEMGKSVGESGKIEIITCQNLVDNGYMENGKPFNNSSLGKFDEENKPPKSIKALSYNYARLDLMGEEYIPIDVNNDYTLSLYAKDNGQNAIFYAGMMYLDYDKKSIDLEHNTFKPNTTTYLTQKLKKGDTEIYVNSLENWVDSTKSFIVWGYKDSTGYVYPDETYSRYFYSKVINSLDTENNVIKLEKAWEGEEFEVGRALSQGKNWMTNSIAGPYLYSLIRNKKLSDSWEKYSINLSGTIDNAPVLGKPQFMLKGAKYMRIIIWHDYSYGYYNKEKGISPTKAWYANYVIAETKNYENKVYIDMQGKEPIRSMEDGTRDYIDIGSRKIARNIGINEAGEMYKLEQTIYEDINIPSIPCYYKNTIITVNDEVETDLELLY